jgi:CRP/FNR family transcriptional regulator, cyclic AMP receptor protein
MRIGTPSPQVIPNNYQQDAGISMSLMSHEISEIGSRANAHTGASFSTPTGAELEHFYKIAHDITHPGGSVIFREGEPATGTYLVCTGQVKLIMASAERHKMIIKIAKPGDVLGLSEILIDLPYEVTAETIIPSSFKHIGRQVFLNSIRASAEASYATAQAIAKEHHEVFLSARRFALSLCATARIAHALIELSRSASTQKNCPSFPLLLTHAELASLAGTSRETVTRLLNQFERDGIISRSNSIVTVVQLERLEQLAN